MSLGMVAIVVGAVILAGCIGEALAKCEDGGGCIAVLLALALLGVAAFTWSQP